MNKTERDKGIVALLIGTYVPYISFITGAFGGHSPEVPFGQGWMSREVSIGEIGIGLAFCTYGICKVAQSLRTQQPNNRH